MHNCHRYDLLNQYYQAMGKWDEVCTFNIIIYSNWASNGSVGYTVYLICRVRINDSIDFSLRSNIPVWLGLALIRIGFDMPLAYALGIMIAAP